MPRPQTQSVARHQLVPVHFLGQAWEIGTGWINLALVVAVRPVTIDLDALCPECAEKAVRTGIVPPCLAVRTVEGSRYRLLGDGLHDDADAVQQARRLLRLRQRCEREQHLPSGPLRRAGRLLGD